MQTNNTARENPLQVRFLHMWVERYELVAGAFSSNPERALASGKELGIAEDRNYQNFHEMAEKESHREDKIDAVAVVTHNHMHHPVSMEFMNKGFHIICDKPLAMNLKQCEELVQASQSNNILFALTHNYTGYPMIRNAKAMCEKGDIEICHWQGIILNKLPAGFDNVTHKLFKQIVCLGNIADFNLQ